MPAFDTPFVPSADSLVMRIGSSQIHVTAPYGDAISQSQTDIVTMKGGMSATANLREAFKSCSLLSKDISSITVLVDAPTMLVPAEEFDAETYPALFDHVYTSYPMHVKARASIQALHTEVVYAIEKDMMTVVGDHASDYRILPVTLPVWRYLHLHGHGHNRRKLFAYFHDDKADVFSVRQNRFVFANTFVVTNEHDALYFLLYTWSQMKLDSEKDELHLIGDVLNRRWLNERLRLYLRRPYFDTIEPLAGKMTTSCKPIPADIQALADLGD